MTFFTFFIKALVFVQTLLTKKCLDIGGDIKNALIPVVVSSIFFNLLTRKTKKCPDKFYFFLLKRLFKLFILIKLF